MPPCLTKPQVEEDPDHEFPPSTADEPPLTGPRIIEVGIKGPGAHPTLWRRAWRDKILPAVVNFNPDLILVSAGFDAHRKDVINYRCERWCRCCGGGGGGLRAVRLCCVQLERQCSGCVLACVFDSSVTADECALPQQELCMTYLCVLSCLHRYIGVTEADYEWLTDQIVQVANR